MTPNESQRVPIRPEPAQVRLDDLWGPGRPLKAPEPSSPPPRPSICSQDISFSQPCDNAPPCLSGSNIQASAPSPTPNAERRSVQQLTMRRYCSQQGSRQALRRSLSQKSILPRRLEMQWSGRAHGTDSETESEVTEREIPRLRLSSTRTCAPSAISTCHTRTRRAAVRAIPDFDDYTTPVPIKRRTTLPETLPISTEAVPSRALNRWSTPVPGTMIAKDSIKAFPPSAAAAASSGLSPVRENIEPMNRGITPVGEPASKVKEIASDEPVNRKRHREGSSSHCRKLHCRH